MLGEYQFRRCLFAREYLYPGEWDLLFSFAFALEPTDRCLSMFHYLFWQDSARFPAIVRPLWRFLTTRRLYLSTAYAFDAFLDYAREARLSASIYSPFGLHFTTHTVPMWDDVTDLEGNILLTQVFRLERLTDAINLVFDACGIRERREAGQPALNRNSGRRAYAPNRAQRAKIEAIYRRDFDLYENAWH